MNAIAKKRCTPLKVFLGFSLLNLALFLLLIPFLGQKGFDWAVMENNSHLLSVCSRRRTSFMCRWAAWIPTCSIM